MENNSKDINIEVTGPDNPLPIQTMPSDNIIPSDLTVTTTGNNFRTVTPENGTENFISSSIDILCLIAILLIVVFLDKLKKLGVLGKIGINKLKVFLFLKDATEGLREEAKEEAIKTLREKNIKVTGLQHMSKETIDKYDKDIRNMIEEVAKDKLLDNDKKDK